MISYRILTPRPTRPSRTFTLILATILLSLINTATVAAQVCSGDCLTSQLLGPHGDLVRGCVICHAPHSSPSGPHAPALWGNTAPTYGATLVLADESLVVRLRPGMAENGPEEISGILLCLSCHDGNLTPENMVQASSYERQVGLLATTPYRDQKIATLLGDADRPAPGHPLGLDARIPAGNGLIWSDGKFTVVPGTPYSQFVANYGWPALSPRRSTVYGVSRGGEPYALCTTCHDQHVRSSYASGTDTPIASDSGGKSYITYFFLNGPYNPNIRNTTDRNASSSTQFCRQCHFAMANEAHNANEIPTAFQ